MGGHLLEVDTKAIKFICEVKKQSTSSVHLSNISDQYVAFKVKTTSPKKYCVRPNSGVINPKSSCDFKVTMQGLRSAPSDLECKDKFLIQSTVVDPETREEDVTLDLFSKSSGKYVEEKKLRVILVIKQDSPVEEHKDKVSEPEPSKEAPIKEENLVEKEENLVKNEENLVKKEENLAKTEENVSPKHMQNEDVREVKHALTAEVPKPSGDHDENQPNHSKNLKSKPVKEVKEEPEKKLKLPVKEVKEEPEKKLKLPVKEEPEKKLRLPVEEPEKKLRLPVKEVKEDPEKKLRLSNQLKDLKLKENALEHQLKEAKSTISTLTYQNNIVIEAKDTLQQELARRSKKGFSFVFVCGVSLVGLTIGYLLHP